MAKQITVEALSQRLSKLEDEFIRLQLLLESAGVSRSGDAWRPGEYELKRGFAVSTRP